MWRDYDEAASLFPDHHVGAVNEAGRDFDGPLALWCSLHPEKMPRWQRERARAGRSTDYTCVCNKAHPEARIDRTFGEVWGGSSGLYICQVAILALGFDRIILCGIPMDASKHYHGADGWDAYPRYRDAWIEATDQQELRGRIRSMSGWTAGQLGRPDIDWL